MWDQFTQIFTFVIESLLNVWPYLLLSIPLAVAVRVTDASRYIRQAFDRRPLIAILLATLVGAFSPFCSCTVIPLITSLLIAGVPLGPVMAFWIASPTMDPEIFLLSMGVLGWELAVVRVAATLVLSLGAGIAAHQLEQRGFFVNGVLRERRKDVDWSWRGTFQTIRNRVGRRSAMKDSTPAVSAARSDICCTLEPVAVLAAQTIPVMQGTAPIPVYSDRIENEQDEGDSCGCASSAGADCADGDGQCSVPSATPPVSTGGVDWHAIRRESIDATWFIVKFMLIAFLLEALIQLYVPQTAIVALLGQGNPLAIGLSALVGVPVYTTNIAAIPLVGGLLDGGMLPGAALAFLIAGPATTIPAMSAVYGIAKPRVFALYVGVTLVGAVLLGYVYQMFAI